METALLKVSPPENNENEKYNYKLTDEEFLAILNENHGLLSQTVRAISQKYGIKFSRHCLFFLLIHFCLLLSTYSLSLSYLYIGYLCINKYKSHVSIQLNNRVSTLLNNYEKINTF
jgi:hypothetical protein